ncbi:MAG: tRNA (guanosine(46)-N7)-methyltransferase TrmB [Cyanobacteria bacterium]|nr:tRNA (guanosine(46)-N7)-methyltransferase TrmB [Cyanobacteriota bacterium]MDA0866751.1 tRNA (guanosine(46)-N7)-methyltransferase TrmB [Cyanobacteriota bacterium]
MAVRVRHHVNPLSNKYQGTVEPPPWPQTYARPHQPLHLDIGSAKGYFLETMAGQCPDWNFLGVEIRQPLVEDCLKRRDHNQQENLHFIFCNANTALKDVLNSLPDGQLQRASIQFPDPWFKKRHQKRRVVQSELVALLAETLPQGGEVVLQSDVLDVAEAMVDCFGEDPRFYRTSDRWLPESPFPAQTEREELTLGNGLPVYRAIFQRC